MKILYVCFLILSVCKPQIEGLSSGKAVRNDDFILGVERFTEDNNTKMRFMLCKPRASYKGFLISAQAAIQGTLEPCTSGWFTDDKPNNMCLKKPNFSNETECVNPFQTTDGSEAEFTGIIAEVDLKRQVDEMTVQRRIGQTAGGTVVAALVIGGIVYVGTLASLGVAASSWAAFFGVETVLIGQVDMSYVRNTKAVKSTIKLYDSVMDYGKVEAELLPVWGDLITDNWKEPVVLHSNESVGIANILDLIRKKFKWTISANLNSKLIANVPPTLYSPTTTPSP